MPTLLLYGFVALAVLGALGGISKAIYDAGADSVRLEWNAAREQAREEAAMAAFGASEKLEVQRGQAKVVYRTITRTVDKIVDRPVYRNVCLDDDGLRAVRDAIRGRATEPATGEPNRAVPASGADRGRDGRGGAAVDGADR